MVTRTIDPLLQEQVWRILGASGCAPSTAQPWVVEPINNSFQAKGNVFKLHCADHPSFILKLEHPFFEARLQQEAYILDFLATTDVPAPHLIQTGVCDIYHVGDLFPTYLLMEYVAGVPLNWVYYRAGRAERRMYLRHVVELIGKLASLQVRQHRDAPCIGSPADILHQHDGCIGCHRLAPFQHETVGPFVTVDDMFQQQLALWLERLHAQHGPYHEALYTAWQRLDRAVLAHHIPVCLAHADIAPMNIMVNPQAQVITGLIDWEFSGFYPIDMDFHSVLYYDQHQAWKWCGPDDVRMAHAIMHEVQLCPPDGYDERLVWFDVLQLTKDLCQYQQWFAQAPAALKQYEQSLDKRLAALFATVRVQRA